MGAVTGRFAGTALGAALLAAAVLLAGCAGGPGGPPTPPATDTPDPDGTPAPVPGLVVERPAPLWSIDCAELGTLFGSSLDGLTLLDPPLAEFTGAFFENPLQWRDAVTNQGGLNCVWGNEVGRAVYLGEPYIYTRGGPLGGYSDARYLSVVALPGAAEGYRANYGFTGSDFTSSACQWNNDHSYTNADYEAAVGEDWVRINLMLGPAGCDQYWTPRVQQVIDRIAQSRLPGPVVRPADVPALPTSCDALIAPVDALLAAPVGAYPYALADTIEPLVSLRRGKLQCAWGAEWSVLLTALEGGAWLLPDYHAWATTAGEPVAIESTALRPGDQAWGIHLEGAWVFWASLSGNLYRGWATSLPPGQEAARLSALIEVLAAWQGTP